MRNPDSNLTFVLMHAGLSTILYIVLGLIFVLAKFSRKKKAVQTTVPDEPVSKPEESASPLSSLWNEFWDAPEVSPQPETSPAKPAPSPPPAGHAEPAQPSVDQQIDNQISGGYELEESAPEINHFDLKSAVIYTVLLERKYD